MAAMRSATLTKAPRRVRFPVSSPTSAQLNSDSLRWSEQSEVRNVDAVVTALDSRMFMGAVVVHDQVQFHFEREFRIQTFQESEKLDDDCLTMFARIVSILALGNS
jgi:hypothetical protein